MPTLPHTAPSERVVLGNRYAHSIPSLVCSLNALEPSIAPSELGGSVRLQTQKDWKKLVTQNIRSRCRRQSLAPLTPRSGLCTSSPTSAAAAIGIVRERCNAQSCCIRVLQSHRTRVQPLVVAIPFAKPAMSCLDFISQHVPRLDRVGDLELA